MDESTMKDLGSICLCVSVALSACSSTSSNPVPAGSTGGKDASSSAGPGGASSAGGTSTATGGAPNGGTAVRDAGKDGSRGGDAAVDGGYVPPPGAQVVTLMTTPYMLSVGAEAYVCQNFDNPFGAKDVAVQDIVTEIPRGTHHVNIFYGTNGETSRALEPCLASEFHPLLHSAAEPRVETRYAPGMAAKLLGTTGIRMLIHYLNMTTSPLDIGVKATFTAVDPSTVDKWVSQLYFSNTFLSVLPGQGATTEATCTIPSEFGSIALLGGNSHMLSHGAEFTACVGVGCADGGTNLIQASVYSDPPAVTYNPPIVLNPGDSITWKCLYANQTPNTLTYGPGANQEECIYAARFYSSPTGKDLSCAATKPSGQNAQAVEQVLAQ